MATGLGALGIAPAALWAMTPKELEAAIRGRFGQTVSDGPLTRGDLGALMHLFPDAPGG